MSPHIETFQSSQTPWEVFQSVYTNSKVCFFLDTPHYRLPDQIYSYIGMDPVLEIRVDQDTLSMEGERTGKYPARKTFSVLRKLFKQKGGQVSFLNKKGPDAFAFFTGGWAGYFGYEFADLCDRISFRPKKELGIPRLYWGLFRDVIVYDHKRRIYYLVINARGAGLGTREAEKIKAYFDKTNSTESHFQLKKIRPEMSKKRFKGMVKKAKEYIAAGDIYQANLSQRFSFDFAGSSLELYGKLRAINPSPFSCFFKINDLEMISSSPERLIRKQGRICETRPIAGTCPVRDGPFKKGPSRASRWNWRRKLLKNPKERAEHLMLVDLERNDLGRVCDYRSVHVEEFMTLEKYSHVVHIVSKVVGKIRKGNDAFDLIKVMFPGGTITGCPKIRCMEIIDELEPVRRGIYTGSLGYLGLNGNMDLNIVIRTLILRKNKGHLQVGAGIVYDSDPEKEYEETLHKAKALIQALAEAGAER